MQPKPKIDSAAARLLYFVRSRHIQRRIHIFVCCFGKYGREHSVSQPRYRGSASIVSPSDSKFGAPAAEPTQQEHQPSWLTRKLFLQRSLPFDLHPCPMAEVCHSDHPARRPITNSQFKPPERPLTRIGPVIPLKPPSGIEDRLYLSGRI